MKDFFRLNYPPRIIFGAGSISELPDNIPQGSKVLLVTGNSAVKSGLCGRMLKLLETFSPAAVSGIPSEPPLDAVDDLVKRIKKQTATAVVAVGGGTVIDAAKAAAALSGKDGCCADYFYERKKISSKGLFFTALPTTAGTGAEITNNAVLTDPEKKIKRSIRHQFLVPDLAIVDPLLTLSAPVSLTAASGLDALTQAIESFTSSGTNFVSRKLAESAVVLLMKNIQSAWEDGNNISARTEMAKGSLLSAMAFSQSGLGAVHALSHPLGSLLSVPHGLTCGILLNPVLKCNLPVCKSDYAVLAAACGLNSPEDFLCEIFNLCRRLDVPEKFSSFGLKIEYFQFIIKNCRSGSMECNPRPMTDADIESLLFSLL